MNERIKELAEHAGFFPKLNWDHTEWHTAGHNNTFEKFAELIVRECAGIAYEYDAPKMSGPGMIIAGRIEQHFGVEE